MPTYQYACTDCGDRIEVVQKFTDDPLTQCSACDGRLRKVFSAVGVVFKGSGFYRTDSRSTANGAKTKATEGSSAKDSGTSDSSSTSGGGTESTAGKSTGSSTSKPRSSASATPAA